MDKHQPAKKEDDNEGDGEALNRIHGIVDLWENGKMEEGLFFKRIEQLFLGGLHFFQLLEHASDDAFLHAFAK